MYYPKNINIAERSGLGTAVTDANAKAMIVIHANRADTTGNENASVVRLEPRFQPRSEPGLRSTLNGIFIAMNLE
jgi:hypothetical protein